MDSGLRIVYKVEDPLWPQETRQVIEQMAHLTWQEMTQNPAQKNIIHHIRVQNNLMPEVELSVVLSNDAGITVLNARWRHKNQPTNILSFPNMIENSLIAGQVALLGDLVLARETLIREAKSHKKSLQSHLAHLTVHGFLHLLGYDHQEDHAANKMEELEKKILAKAGIDDPYSYQDENSPVTVTCR